MSLHDLEKTLINLTKLLTRNNSSKNCIYYRIIIIISVIKKINLYQLKGNFR